ncbi:Leucoanthocyanidin reductase [Ananas comosus]|uniref:Leucoanthocyanidin reductase n=1 Tax=Ananas comosus TaxID=4615 RepID=A0A199VVR3_ANACO|nr:Leucoanthocyanidin reductase [Ananas comosus]
MPSAPPSTAVAVAVAAAAADTNVSGPALIVGATGYIGRFVAEACLDSGRTTYILLRPGGGASPARAAAVDALREKGAVVIEGSVDNKELVEEKLKEHSIEVVISVMGGPNILDQLTLIDAIKSVPTIKRFLPSEFGHDIDKASPVEPGLSFYEEKRRVRRAAEAAGIPYTCICCNSIAGWPYFDNTHPSEVPPPLDRFQIYGDGTVKAAYDLRALNKIVHFRPACNLLNMNEMASLWESKIGRALPRATLSEEDLLALATAENCIPASIVAALTHDIFINGCQTNFSLDGIKDIEISWLYPDVPFRTVDECFDEHVASLPLDQISLESSPSDPVVKRLPVPPTCA